MSADGTVWCNLHGRDEDPAEHPGCYAVYKVEVLTAEVMDLMYYLAPWREPSDPDLRQWLMERRVRAETQCKGA